MSNIFVAPKVLANKVFLKILKKPPIKVNMAIIKEAFEIFFDLYLNMFILVKYI